MMAWVHASIGAALGSEMKTRRSSFAAGVVSHLLADLVPHRDYEMPVEVPLVLVALGYIAYRHGIKSREMAGALGAISPDIENGLARLNVVPETWFPTHTGRPWFIGHGRRIDSPMPQVLLAAACLYAAHCAAPRKD